jgi:hypothetical protein
VVTVHREYRTSALDADAGPAVDHAAPNGLDVDRQAPDPVRWDARQIRRNEMSCGNFRVVIAKTGTGEGGNRKTPKFLM